MRTFLFILLIVTSASAAMINVPADYATVSAANAAATKGDTIVIAAGDYDESVYVTTAGLTFQAATPRTALLRAFRIGATNVVLNGLKLTRFSGVGNTWSAAVRIEADAHNCVVTNCWISDAPWVKANDFRFDAASNYVYSLSSDFVAAGFTNGSKVYLGSCGLTNPPLWYTNHDTFWTVASNTAHGMWLTNAAADSFATDAGSNYWAFIRATDTLGLYGIYTVYSGGAGPTNMQILGNVISNWTGTAISVNGTWDRVEGNWAVKLNSFLFLSSCGDNLIVRSNVVRHSPNVIHYSQDEGNYMIHTGDWYDYYVAMSRSESTASQHGGTNQLFEWNWFEDLEDQMGRIDDYDLTTWGITFRHNVFVGCAAHFSHGRDDMLWQSNTFYRCAYSEGYADPLSIGTTGAPLTNFTLLNNLFIDCASVAEQENNGWYSISGVTNAVADSNMVCGAQFRGWPSKAGFSEAHGVNGGNPGLFNLGDPIGPDGLPFTADDGLQTLPNSLGASIGGAEGVKATSGYPIAAYSVVGATNWLEATGTNYNPDWWTSLPTARTNVVRPYDTPNTIGEVPCTVTFDASASMSGIYDLTNTYGIARYYWNFGDGATNMTRMATHEHTFLWPGDFTVTLTVENNQSKTSTVVNVYRVAPQAAFTNHVYHVATNGNDSTGDGTLATPWLTLAKAVTQVDEGDYVAVHPGYYDEYLDVDRDVATSSNRISFIAYGASIGGMKIRYPFFTFDGFDTSYTVQNAADSPFYVFSTADGTHLVNNHIHNTTNGYPVYINGSGTARTHPSDGRFVNNIIEECPGPLIVVVYCSNWVFSANQVMNNWDEADFIRPIGESIVIADNYCTNNNTFYGTNSGSGHVDFFQIYDTTHTAVMRNITIERNTVIGWPESPTEDAAIGQVASSTNNSSAHTNLVIRNNLFINVRAVLSDSIDGLKLYNNLFYYSPREQNHVTTGGGVNGSSYGTELYNNIFYYSSTNDTTGWYYNAASGSQASNTTVYADYNLVYPEKNTAPPNDTGRWGYNGLEAHGLNGSDPIFVDAANGDYRLATNSPALVGTNLSAIFTDDALGTARPAVGNWSMGPFEATGGGSSPPTPPSVTGGAVRVQGGVLQGVILK